MINEAKIKSDIVSLIRNNDSTDTDESIDKFADGMSKIIANAIKSATVTVNAGIPVATAGTAASQTGSTTGTGTGSLS